jgi:diaminopimelate epimerase
MMRTTFTKMHGLGNDFVVIRSDDGAPPGASVIRGLADRSTGIGFDQLLWLEPARAAGADIYYRVFNADGGEVEQCGNGARCIARLVAETTPQELVLEHAGGTSRAIVHQDGRVSVDMGAPEFRPELIPFTADAEQPAYELQVDDEAIEIGAVSMGNPHGVVLVDSVDDAPVETLGPKLESHARFPNRANIGFMQVVASDRIRLRVYERGVGETRACGTGACAAAVIGRRNQNLDESITVELPGGELTIRWEGPGAPVWMTGEALITYEGTVEI